MPRFLPIAACSVLVSGCISLGAKPQAYECPAAEAFIRDYAVAPIFDDIQRDGHDDQEGTGWFGLQALQEMGQAPRPDPIYLAIGGQQGNKPLGPIGSGGTKRMLLLSGGGQWGAFGAGFLQGMHAREQRRYDVITGVSTGALQALLVGMSDYERLVSEYRRKDQQELIKTGGLLTAVKTGYVNDTNPLRERVERLLCNSDTDCPGIAKLSAADTEVFVGSVELATGKFRSFSITAMADAVHGRVRHPGSADPRLDRRQAKDCITGAIMASVAVPVFLRPVTMNSKTYVDGGVRLSVFEAVIGSMAEAVDKQGRYKVELDVVRNGPTVLEPDARDPATGRFQADLRPDAAKNALRSYSAIVNQAEVMSLAGLRLSRPTGQIRYVTADGYKARGNCPRTMIDGKQSDAMFDIDFMHCLINWGANQAGNGWRKLPETDRAVSKKPGGNDI